jgi:hypothetical protein
MFALSMDVGLKNPNLSNNGFVLAYNIEFKPLMFINVG